MKIEIKKVIQEYMEEYSDLNATKLADKILEDNAISNKSHRTIRSYIGELKNLSLIEPDTDVPEVKENSENDASETSVGKLITALEEKHNDRPDLTAPVNESFTKDKLRDVLLGPGPNNPPEQPLIDIKDVFPTEEEQPELYKTIEELHTDTDTDGPIDSTVLELELESKEVEMKVIDEESDPITDEDLKDFFTGVDEITSPYYILANEVHSTDNYDIDNLEYCITVGKNTFNISVQLVDKVFCAYSRKGLNLSKPIILNNLSIEPAMFNAILNKLNLTKESNTYGPFTEEFMESEDIYAAVMDNTRELLDLVKDSDSATLEALIKEYKQAYVELCNKNLKYDEFIGDLSEKLQFINITVPSTVPISSDTSFISGAETVNVVLTDLHLGLNLPTFNYKIAREKLKEIARNINSIGAKSVTVSFLGDSTHTISGINHAYMWKTLEQDAWGADAIIKPFEIIVEFLISIINLKKVVSVGGNHDRMHNNKDVEPTAEGAKLLFYMIQSVLKDVDVVHTNHNTPNVQGDLMFINLHGDQGLDKKASEKIIWRYGDQSKFNFILEGHFHSRIIPKDEDGSNFRKMHCPAFCPTDSYATGLGVDSVPGWLMIIEREGLPMVIDVPIQYERGIK